MHLFTSSNSSLHCCDGVYCCCCGDNCSKLLYSTAQPAADILQGFSAHSWELQEKLMCGARVELDALVIRSAVPVQEFRSNWVAKLIAWAVQGKKWGPDISQFLHVIPHCNDKGIEQH